MIHYQYKLLCPFSYIYLHIRACIALCVIVNMVHLVLIIEMDMEFIGPVACNKLALVYPRSRQEACFNEPLHLLSLQRIGQSDRLLRCVS